MSTQKSEKEKKKDENYGKNYKNWRSRWRAAITARQPLTYSIPRTTIQQCNSMATGLLNWKNYWTGLTATVGAAVLGLTIAKWVLSSTSISWKGKQNDWVWFLWEISNKVTVVELRLASLISYVNVSRIGFLSLSPFRDVAKYILLFSTLWALFWKNIDHGETGMHCTTCFRYVLKPKKKDNLGDTIKALPTSWWRGLPPNPANYT